MKKLPNIQTAFADWYNELVLAAGLADYGPVRGTMIIKPYGYAIWEHIQRQLDAQIKATGHDNAYFPLLIPKSFLQKEQEHIEGFSPELAVVTHGGGKKLEEPLIVRPTSETIMYDAFSRWISSYRDLPLLINQWANVVRWELRTRLFLRTLEFLWQEGHTAHATEEEAEKEARKMLEVYRIFAEEVLAIPVVAGDKSETEKFAGADHTYAIEGLMHDGKSIQMGTSHRLGQNFSKSFHIKFLTKEGRQSFVWQTSWGVSTRLIGSVLMAHGDQQGIRLPPAIAPYHAVIIPIGASGAAFTNALEAATKLQSSLQQAGLRTHLDRIDDETPGFKFNKWEQRGVPIRIELGDREIAAKTVRIVRRDTGEKQSVKMDASLGSLLLELCADIQKTLFEQASQRVKGQTAHAATLDELAKHVEQGWVHAPWCGETSCEAKVKEKTKATICCIPFSEKQAKRVCVVCGKPASREALFARAY